MKNYTTDLKIEPGEPIWLSKAKEELGIKEIMGVEHNGRIIEYHSATDLKATKDEVPWCSSFLNWVMAECGYKPTRSAAAISWEDWGVELDELKEGCIVVLKRGTESWQRHVGFYIKDRDKSSIFLLGGNQSDRVCVAPYGKWRITAIRWPFEN